MDNQLEQSTALLQAQTRERKIRFSLNNSKPIRHAKRHLITSQHHIHIFNVKEITIPYFRSPF